MASIFQDLAMRGGPWIDVLLDEPIARIDHNVYGHFVEHVGDVVYDGIWVGEQSRVTLG